MAAAILGSNWVAIGCTAASSNAACPVRLVSSVLLPAPVTRPYSGLHTHSIRLLGTPACQAGPVMS